MLRDLMRISMSDSLETSPGGGREFQSITRWALDLNGPAMTDLKTTAPTLLDIKLSTFLQRILLAEQAIGR